MFLITLLFYKEPEREIEGVSLTQKLKDIAEALSDFKFSLFLVLLGLFFWLPFWAFFNLCALYVDKNIDTVQLYLNMKTVLGTAVANFFAPPDEDGVRRVLGETISHTGYIIMFLQVFVSRAVERFSAIPSFLFGLFVSAIGFVILGLASVSVPGLVFLGIFLFALGEMISSPRIQEYITWIAPKEKAGLYMGSNFLAVGIGGATSGVVYTSLYGYFRDANNPGYVWYVLAGHLIIAIVVLLVFSKTMGDFAERDE
jgi:dipeptide/tripeptide permease